MSANRIGRGPAVMAAGLSLTLVAACGGGFGSEPEAGGELTLLFGSSGDAETSAVKEALAAWSEESGVPAEAVPAQDLGQQLRQGFAGGTPPDVFYLAPDQVRQYAEGGSLHPYGDDVADADDFYPALRDTYTHEDELYCLPKDQSTHALVINTELWSEAGLGEDDIPTTWEELESVAGELTGDGRVGFALGGEYHQVGTLMQQAGGWFVNDDETEVTADTPENREALDYLRDNLEAGDFSFVKDIDASSGSEALGNEKAAMVLDGDWVTGAFEHDYPDLDWEAVELPEGPDGKATTVFSNCWGIAEDSGDKEAAVELVEFLASEEQQQEFSRAFGAAPSRESLADWHAEEFPEKEAFGAGAEYARGPVTTPGFRAVLEEFNTGLEGLAAGTATPEGVLEQLQANGDDVIERD